MKQMKKYQWKSGIGLDKQTKNRYIHDMKKHINNSDTIDCVRINGTLIPRLHGGRREIRFKSIKDYNRRDGKAVRYDD